VSAFFGRDAASVSFSLSSRRRSRSRSFSVAVIFLRGLKYDSYIFVALVSSASLAAFRRASSSSSFTRRRV
jgi:hypothetical protein